MKNVWVGGGSDLILLRSDTVSNFLESVGEIFDVPCAMKRLKLNSLVHLFLWNWRVYGILAISIAMMGCSKPLETSVLGKWKEADGTVLYFFSDYKFSLGNGTPTIGTWFKVDQKTIRLDVKSGGQETIVVLEDVRVYSDTMTLTLGEKATSFSREK